MEPMFFFFYVPSDPQHVRTAAAMYDGPYDVMPDVSIATMRTFLNVAANSADEPSAKILAERAGLNYAQFMRHIGEPILPWRANGEAPVPEAAA